MKIKNLFLDRTIVNKYGLEEFKSSKLNSIVALVGKNGSGKTRYLNAIRESISTAKINDIFNEKFDFLPERLVKSVDSLANFKPIFEAEDKLTELQSKSALAPQDQQIKQEIARQNARVQSLMKSMQYSQRKNIIDNTQKTISTELQNRIKVINASDIRALKE